MNLTDISPASQHKLYGFNNVFLDIVKLHSKKNFQILYFFQVKRGLVNQPWPITLLIIFFLKMKNLSMI